MKIRNIRRLMAVAIVIAISLGAVALMSLTSHRSAVADAGIVIDGPLVIDAEISTGPILMQPLSDRTQAVVVSDREVSDLLVSSGALEMLRGGAASVIDNARAYVGFVSDMAMSEAPGGRIDGALSNSASPGVVRPLRDVPAIIVVFDRVAWIGLHGGGGAMVDDGANAPGPQASNVPPATAVIAFDLDSKEFLFFRTFHDS